MILCQGTYREKYYYHTAVVLTKRLAVTNRSSRPQGWGEVHSSKLSHKTVVADPLEAGPLPCVIMQNLVILDQTV